MNSQTKFLRRILGLFLLLSVITLVSCKKDKEVEDLKKSSFIGVWTNVKRAGAYRDIVTNITLRADRTGNFLLINSTGSNQVIASDEEFKWTTENDKVLKLQFETEAPVVYNYVLMEGELPTLTLTSEYGDEVEYYKSE